MKLDLGCGYKKREGYTRVDHDSRVIPDVCHDLEVFPWPFDADSVDGILMSHVLEHLAPLPSEYRQLWQEIYRICKHGAEIHVDVPHWNHENMIHDPTHVRRITPITLAMMDQTRNKQDIERDGGETTLGLQWCVDFKMESVAYSNDPMTGLPVNCHYNISAVKPARVTGAALLTAK
jgi:SAM-dependent methyltransferase